MVEPITWMEGTVRFLDQTRLPHETIMIETDDPAVIIGAIQVLAIRGAPLIGIAGAYAAALSARRHLGRPWSQVHDQWRAIAEARPTAVNLRWAVGRMQSAVQPSDVVTRMDIEALDATACLIHEEDRQACDRIGEHGATLLPDGARVLTHCNTGSLATGGIGTAFGVVRRSWERGRLSRVYIDETRPLLQGSRLTAWEAGELGLPATLLTDSMAAVVMGQRMVDAVIVGADRIAANGDVANKVGTYGLAVLARAHEIPFFVAAPVTSIDLAAPDGRSIPIEQRDADEILTFAGKRVAPSGTVALNPAFDVTPADLVSAIVTDRGIIRPPSTGMIAAMAGTAVPS